MEPRKTKSNLCPSELADDKTNYDSQTQDTEPGKIAGESVTVKFQQI